MKYRQTTKDLSLRVIDRNAEVCIYGVRARRTIYTPDNGHTLFVKWYGEIVEVVRRQQSYAVKCHAVKD